MCPSMKPGRISRFFRCVTWRPGWRRETSSKGPKSAMRPSLTTIIPSRDEAGGVRLVADVFPRVIEEVEERPSDCAVPPAIGIPPFNRGQRRGKAAIRARALSRGKRLTCHALPFHHRSLVQSQELRFCSDWLLVGYWARISRPRGADSSGWALCCQLSWRSWPTEDPQVHLVVRPARPRRLTARGFGSPRPLTTRTTPVQRR